MSAELMENQIDSLKDQDQQEFNDHFAPIYQPDHEKQTFEPNMHMNRQQTSPPIPENKLHHFNNNSFMMMQQKQLLQRDFHQNQRQVNENQQRSMKIVMSEPKFLHPGFPVSNSHPNLGNTMGMGLIKDEALGNRMGLTDNSENIGAEANNMKKQKGNVKNTYIKKINSLINLSRIEETHLKNER